MNWDYYERRYKLYSLYSVPTEDHSRSEDVIGVSLSEIKITEEVVFVDIDSLEPRDRDRVV